MKYKKQNGFTFIELIVVVGVMAILVGAITPVTVQYLEGQRKNTTIDNIAAIGEAIEEYYKVNNAFPPNLNSLIPDYINPKFTDSTERTDNSVLYDKWRQQYRYRNLSAVTAEIRSSGPDRRMNNRDDIVKTINTFKIRVEKTEKEITSLQQKVNIYNALRASNPGSYPALSTTSWPQALRRLQISGLLPNNSSTYNEYRRDEWNRNYSFDGVLIDSATY